MGSDYRIETAFASRPATDNSCRRGRACLIAGRRTRDRESTGRPSRFTPFLVLLAPLLLPGCGVPARSIERVHAGMDRGQVVSMMGAPDTVVHSPGKECAYYALLKDFWSRVPWSISERYVVCYAQGKVETFGRVDGAPSG